MIPVVPSSPLRPFAVWQDGSECSILVFARSHAEARKVGRPVIQGWEEEGPWRIRARLAPERLAGLAQSTEPHVIDDPPSCEDCFRWTGMDGGRCLLCEEDGE